MFWQDMLQIWLLIFGPCLITQLIVFFVPFCVFFGVSLWLKSLWLPRRDD